MTIAWFLPDERRNEAQAILDRVVSDGAIVPSLWRLEIANSLRNAVQRGRCGLGYAERSIARLASLPIDIDPETDLHAWGRTRDLSNEYNLTMYDAAYLELALRRRVPLASRDTALIAAARRAHLDVLAD